MKITRKIKVPLQLLTFGALALFFMGKSHGETAEIGMVAPPLDVKNWVKGGPVALEEGKGKQIYVIDFWATWCTPCLASIPHLSELQKQYKDQGVTFIGVSDEELGVVKPFVEQEGSKMDYHVAVDNDYGTNKGYVQAFGEDTLPYAFIIDRTGHIVWHGDPLLGLDAALQLIASKDYKFDADKVKLLQKAQTLLPVYLYMIDKVHEPALETQVSDLMLKYSSGDRDFLMKLGSSILDVDKADDAAIQLALKTARTLYDNNGAQDFETLKLYGAALERTGNKPEAEKIMKQAETLNRVAVNREKAALAATPQAPPAHQ